MMYRRTLIISLLFIVLHIVFAYFIPQFISFGTFPYLDDLIKSGFPPYIYSFANFDGAQYLKIAQSGYLPLTQAFFPLYPILIRAFSLWGLFSSLLSGLIISYLSFFGMLLIPLVNEITILRT